MVADFLMVPLGEVIKQRQEFITINDVEPYKRCRVQLHSKGIVLRDIVSGSEIKTKKQQVCHAGEFLVAEIDAKVGGFGIVPNELDGAIVSSHYFLFQLDNRALDTCFLDFFIRTPSFRDQIKAKGSTNYAAIRPSDVYGYKIPLPSLDEQKRIVALIKKLIPRLEEASRLRQQLIRETDAILSSEIHRLFLNSPCPTAALEKVAEKIADINHAMPKSVEEGKKLVSPKDFTKNGIDFSNCKLISKEDFDKLRTKIQPQRGDVLFSRIGTIGEARLVTVDEEFIASYSIITIRPNLQICDPHYLVYMLQSQSILDQARRGVRSIAMPDLGISKIRKLLIPIPPIPEQRRIVAHLDDLQANIDTLKRFQTETATELDALLPSVLDKAFKGEL